MFRQYFVYILPHITPHGYKRTRMKEKQTFVHIIKFVLWFKVDSKNNQHDHIHIALHTPWFCFRSYSYWAVTNQTNALKLMHDRPIFHSVENRFQHAIHSIWTEKKRSGKTYNYNVKHLPAICSGVKSSSFGQQSNEIGKENIWQMSRLYWEYIFFLSIFVVFATISTNSFFQA